MTDDGIENIATVLPLTHGWDDGLLVALDPKMLPTPQRMGSSGAMLTVPSFVLPKDVKTVEDAKAFIGGKFGLDAADVKQLGESYFTHTGVTPQRVYPFVIMANAEASLPPGWKYTTMKRLWILLYCFSCFSGDLLKGIARTHMALGEEHSMSPERKAELGKTRDFRLSLEKEELYQAGLNSEHRIPSRILGEGSYQGHVHLVDKTITLSQAHNKAVVQVDVGDNVDVELRATKDTKALDKDIDSVKDSLSNHPPLSAKPPKKAPPSNKGGKK